MANVDRVTVTLPDELIRDIDRREKNRSKFIAEAVRNELDRRRRDELRRSLENPHPKALTSPSRDLRSGPAACPRKMPRHWSTATPADQFGGSPAKAGWRDKSETRPRPCCRRRARSL